MLLDYNMFYQNVNEFGRNIDTSTCLNLWDIFAKSI